MTWRRALLSLLSSLRRTCTRKKDTMVYSILPPSSVKGMTSLDRDKFTGIYDVPCLKFNNIQRKEIMPAVKKYTLKLRHSKSIENHEDSVVIYIDPEKIEKFEDFDEKDRNILSKYVDKLETTRITINYENWSSDDIFKAVLPNDIEKPSSFTRVGHILHVNLRESQLPFKELIGQVYLDSVPNVRVVVNKLNIIDTEFRNFSMEILAGDGDTVTSVKENNCKFTFDFAKVYWNSRLSTEHERLIKYMEKGDVLYDVFAGVGPFAVPAGRKGITVLANDLNPESYKWLEINAKANKVKNCVCFNKDGRDFLRNDVKGHLLNRRSQNAEGREHIAMNLPALAVEFLDVFNCWMNTEEEINLILKNPPIVHLYCFVKVNKNEDPKELARELVEEKIGAELSLGSLEVIQYVRNVAPNKEMVRMGKNTMKKELKMRNVFKVPGRGSLNKNKVTKEGGINKKTDHGSLKNHAERIKRIDQQLINLRTKDPSMQSGMSERVSNISKGNKACVKLGKEERVQTNFNDDTLKELKI